MKAIVHFLGGQSIVVDGNPFDLVNGPQGDTERTVTSEGMMVMVNWRNVLYVKEVRSGSPPVPEG